MASVLPTNMPTDRDVLRIVSQRTEERLVRDGRTASVVDVDSEDAHTPTVATAEAGCKRRRVIGDADEAEEEDDDENEDEDEELPRVLRARSDQVVTETEMRARAEAAYEQQVWPDASTAGTPLACLPSRAGAAAAGAPLVEVEVALTAEEMACGYAEGLPAAGREIDVSLVDRAYAQRAPAAAALARAPRQLLDVTARVLPVHESVGGERRLRTDAITLRVAARLSTLAMRAGELREGLPGCEALLHAFVRARGAREACAPAKLSGGLCLPPRAARLGAGSLRSLAGMLDALETEGSAASPPPCPAGLAPGLVVSMQRLTPATRTRGSPPQPLPGHTASSRLWISPSRWSLTSRAWSRAGDTARRVPVREPRLDAREGEVGLCA
jgi:hypothetical protein